MLHDTVDPDREAVRLRSALLRMIYEAGGGCDVRRLSELFDALPDRGGVPHLVIAYTTKGKGVSFIENNAAWHHRVPSPEQYEQARRDLAQQLEKLR